MNPARVVVIEDEPAIRRGVTDALRASGYEAAEAGDGVRGLEEAVRVGVDLVLLDLMLPRRDGLDVLADVREGSPSFGEWESYELDDANGRQLYAPEGFAHGFCVTSDLADVIYKCSTYYDPALEGGFRFNDPAVGIEWPDLELAVSDRDAGAPLLGELTGLPVRYRAG